MSIVFQNKIAQTFLYLTSGCLLSVFTSKTYDIINKYDDIEKQCDTKNVSYNSSIYDNTIVPNIRNTTEANCFKKKNDEIEKYNDTKMVYMLVLGFMFLVVGVYISKQFSNSSMSGISFGGTLLIIWFMIKNWSKFSDIHQVGAIGIILIGLFMAGYNGNSKLDI